jgi:hypothetical protein
VTTFDRELQSYPQSIHNAAAENDDNSLLLDDRTLSDAAVCAIAKPIERPLRL